MSRNKIKVLIVIIILPILYFVYNNMHTNYEWYIKETELNKVWDTTKGENTVIAFLDTGMSKELQKKYKNRIVSPYNFVNNSNDVDDVNGHGTSMICVATCNYRDSGIYGIAPESKVMPIVVTDEAGRTTGELLSNGIRYAVDNNAQIINISLGSRMEDSKVKDAIDYANEKGVIVIAAGGDHRENRILYPAAYNSVIAVQAQSKLGVKYKDASWGEEIDILIPGEFIKTLRIDDETGELIIDYISGSSVASAIFAGVIALKISKENGYKLNELREYIRDFEIEETFINIKDFVK